MNKDNTDNGVKKFVRVIALGVVKNMFNPQPVAKELFSIMILWGTYFMLPEFLSDPKIKEMAPKVLTGIIPYLFWPTVISSSLAYLVACCKSVLPAVIALVLAALMSVFEIHPGNHYALLAANGGILINAICYTLYGGRISAGVTAKRKLGKS